jgi:hypothetical protein
MLRNYVPRRSPREYTVFVDNFVEILWWLGSQVASVLGFDRLMTKEAEKYAMKSTTFNLVRAAQHCGGTDAELQA